MSGSTKKKAITLNKNLRWTIFKDFTLPPLFNRVGINVNTQRGKISREICVLNFGSNNRF